MYTSWKSNTKDVEPVSKEGFISLQCARFRLYDMDGDLTRRRQRRNQGLIKGAVSFREYLSTPRRMKVRLSMLVETATVGKDTPKVVKVGQSTVSIRW